MNETKCPQCGGVNLKWAPHRAIGCADCGWEASGGAVDLSTYTDGGTHKLYSGKPMTNADCIRAMSDEELAEDRVYSHAHGSMEVWCGDFYGWEYTKATAIERELEWLQRPAKEDA